MIELLGNIVDNIQTGPFGSQLHRSDYTLRGTPVIMPQDIVNWRLTTDKIVYVDEDTVDRLKRHKVALNDIIYPRRGDVTKCAMITESEIGWLCGTGCLKISVNPTKANPKYVFYCLQRWDVGKWIEQHATGATMLNINSTTLNDLPIDLPDIRIQNRVIDILSAYDDMIDNCKKQIALLEEAAQRLYREWFVDLRFPGHESTPIGENGLPESWNRYNILDIYDITYGKTLATKYISQKGKYPVYGSSKCIGYFDKKTVSDYKVLITSRGNAGKIHRTYHKESFVTNNSFIITPKQDYDFVPFSYIFYSFINLDLSRIVNGSAQQQLTNAMLGNVSIHLPSKELICAFGQICYNYIDKANKLYSIVEYCNEAKIALLPRLISGQIEINT